MVSEAGDRALRPLSCVRPCVTRSCGTLTRRWRAENVVGELFLPAPRRRQDPSACLTLWGPCLFCVPCLFCSATAWDTVEELSELNRLL